MNYIVALVWTSEIYDQNIGNLDRLLGHFWAYFIRQNTSIYKFKRLFKNEKAKKWDLHFDSPSGKSYRSLKNHQRTHSSHNIRFNFALK